MLIQHIPVLWACGSCTAPASCVRSMSTPHVLACTRAAHATCLCLALIYMCMSLSAAVAMHTSYWSASAPMQSMLSEELRGAYDHGVERMQVWGGEGRIQVWGGGARGASS